MNKSEYVDDLLEMEADHLVKVCSKETDRLCYKEKETYNIIRLQ